MTVERMIELLEIEKECVLRNASGECNRYCAGCDLLQDDTELHEMYTEAIDLLKAQEPRVIPRDAIQASTGSPIWFESRNGRVYTGWALAYDIQRGHGITGERLGVTQPGGRVMWVKPDDYGRTWRMWDKCPTSEQREAAPWE